SLNYAHSDPIGSSSNGAFSNNFPTDQYNVHQDYGRASFDIRDRLFVGGTIGLPRGFRLSPFMIFNSGSPYNVTVGQDLAGDLQFNVRPAFGSYPSGTCPFPTLAACSHFFVPTTPYTQIPINYLTGPSLFTLNLRLAKTFGFGPEIGKNGAQQSGGGGGGGGGGFGRMGGGGNPFNLGAGSAKRYNLTFSVNARNVLNRVNAAPPVGVLSSNDFEKSIALAGGAFSSPAANRRIELQAMFSF